MTPRDLRNIHTTGNSCRDALPCTNMALKLPQYFYLLMEKLLVATSKFGLLTIRQHSATSAQCKHLFPYPQGDRSQGCHYFSGIKFKVNSRFLPTFYPEFKVFVHFSRFYKLSNITIITIFFSCDRLSQRCTSTSTLSKIIFIQLYHNARDRHSSTHIYIPFQMF